jgi:hypothetical protein
LTIPYPKFLGTEVFLISDVFQIWEHLFLHDEIWWQVLYHLGHSTSPFALVYFLMSTLALLLRASLGPQFSCIAGITGIYYHALLKLLFYMAKWDQKNSSKLLQC